MRMQLKCVCVIINGGKDIRGGTQRGSRKKLGPSTKSERGELRVGFNCVYAQFPPPLHLGVLQPLLIDSESSSPSPGSLK
jgi:hypothetical protein